MDNFQIENEQSEHTNISDVAELRYDKWSERFIKTN
jgi:hypothetical protein